MTDSVEPRALPESWIAGQPLEAPVAAVLVMEDRAQVTRRTPVVLKAGRTELAVSPVTPLVADRSLRCRVRAKAMEGEPVRVLDLQVRRRYLVEPERPDRERELAAAIREMEDEYLDVFDRSRARVQQRGLVNQGLNGLQRQICDRLLVGPFDDGWPVEIDDLFGRREELETAILGDRRDQDERLRRLQRLEEERRISLRPVTVYQAGVGIEIEVPVAGDYLLELEYQVPCALWRPAYTAELWPKEEAWKLHWQSAGMVWQATGEDWPGIELSFSTARPTLGADLPLLQDDTLSAREKTEQEKKTVEVTSRDEVIARTSDVPEERQSDTPPGLDDGGEVRTYRVPGLVDVPSDGRPHQIGFERWETTADIDLVTMPEKDEFVFLRSLQANPSRMPLLAGPVALVRQGGFVGRSKIRYVSPGEQFALSWGSEDGLVVLRKTTREYKEAGLRKRRTYRFKTEVYLQNQTGSERQLKVFERIPVSEIEKVSVSLEEEDTTTGIRKDEQGLLHWDVKLADGAETKLRLGFTVSMPQNVRWDG